MEDLEKDKDNRKRVTLKQMASYLNRCERTFRKYVLEYKIPHIRLGRDMLFCVEEVENYLLDLTMKSETSGSVESSIKTVSKTKKSSLNLSKTRNKYAKLLGIS